MLKININNNRFIFFSTFIILLIVLFSFSPLFYSENKIYADCDPTTDSECTCTGRPGFEVCTSPNDIQNGADPDGIETDIGNGCIDQDPDTCLENNALLNDIQMGVNFLAAGVGLVVVVMIMIGGISYITAGENAQAVVAAKAKIRNAVFALIAFALIWSFFEWMIPGGIFR